MSSEVLSPLGLLLRHSRSAHPTVEEAVLFTFNHDLAFFERSALGLIQQTGARITVVADSRVAHHDLYAVRRAGVAYLPGLAWCSGAFHPKLIVLAGSETVMIAVGSGNLSLAGWQGNDELWSVHHADLDQPSGVVAGVASWLRALPSRVVLTDGVPEALTRTAKILDRFAGEESDARFVHSLEQPLIDQLPRGPVDHLALYAPFHDPGALAVGALIKRFEPEHLSIAVQPTLTQINGAATAAHLEGGGFVALADNRYRHGKLVEWAKGTQRWALTGSANLSAAALLRSTRDAGNVEVGVIAPIADSLLPEGVSSSSSTLFAIPYERREDKPSPGVVVLSAVRTADAVTIRLAQPLSQSATVEVSPLGSPPDTWRSVAAMPEGESTTVIIEDVLGGSRIRVRLADDAVSGVVFVIDPARVLRTRSVLPAGPRPPDFEQIFTDPKAAEQLARIVDEFNVDHAQATSGGVTAGSSRPTSAFEVGDWEEYLDRCQGRVGAMTLAFALGLPTFRSGTGSVVDIDWDDEVIDEDESGGLDGEQPEDTPALEESTALTPSMYRMAEHARRRYRGAADSLVHRAREPHERLLGLRFVLMLVAGGAWPHDDESWAGLVLDGVARLDIDSPGPEYDEPAGSLAGLALSIVQSRLSHHEKTAVHERFARTSASVAHLLVGATAERIGQYREGLETRFPYYSNPEIVLDLCTRVVEADPLADALDALAEQGIVAHLNGRVLDLPKPVPQPLLPAFAALVAAEKASPIAIRANGTKGWATILWREPDLAVVQPGAKPGTVFCAHYRYAGGARPSMDILVESRPRTSRRIVQTLAGQPEPPVVAELMRAVGATAYSQE